MKSSAIKYTVLYIVTFSVLLTLGYMSQKQSMVNHLKVELQQWLPERFKQVFSDIYFADNPKTESFQRINRELTSQLKPSQCRAELIHLQAASGLPVRFYDSNVIIKWDQSGQTYHSQFHVDCSTDWSPLFLFSSVITAIGLLFFILLPKPITRGRASKVRQLMEQNETFVSALAMTEALESLSAESQTLMERLVSELDFSESKSMQIVCLSDVRKLHPEDHPWLILGLRLNDGDLLKSLTIARSDSTLCIDLPQGIITVHGVVITLSKTPFFYYCWYAGLRQSGEADGWLVNPSANRPDHDMAKQVLELMNDYGGHKKAVNDLQQNGMRAKTLDQNRNKIKDEFVQLLGEDLAKEYLFESERDLQTGRSRYRIIPAPDKIHFQT